MVVKVKEKGDKKDKNESDFVQELGFSDRFSYVYLFVATENIMTGVSEVERDTMAPLLSHYCKRSGYR